jgi:hypothetical protein
MALRGSRSIGRRSGTPHQNRSSGRPYKAGVAGSSPAPSGCRRGGYACRRPYKAGVAGSSPAPPTHLHDECLRLMARALSESALDATPTERGCGVQGRPSLIRLEKSGARSAACAAALMCVRRISSSKGSSGPASHVVGVLRGVAAQENFPRVRENRLIESSASIDPPVHARKKPQTPGGAAPPSQAALSMRRGLGGR